MSGNHSRNKGANFERELVRYFRDERGLDAKRVPLSGATDYAKGDIEIRPEWSLTHPYVGECKRRAKLPKFLTESLGENDFLALREDRGETLVVLRLKTFGDLLQ